MARLSAGRSGACVLRSREARIGAHPLKVLQVPFHYYPEPVGGTEVYVSSLAGHLRRQGIDAVIAAPGDTTTHYLHDGIPIRRFAVTKTPPDLGVLYGQGDSMAIDGFRRILESCTPDLVHLHAMSPAVSSFTLDEVKTRGIPTIFTCHIPGILCPRGTLLRYGTEVCDGAWNLDTCTRCTMQARGLSLGMAAAAARLPLVVGETLGRFGAHGRAVTALRMKSLQRARRSSMERFLRAADRIVAVSAWLRDMLILNGVPSGKIVLCRHGTSQDASLHAASPDAAVDRESHSALRVAFLGRLNAAKGAHVLVEAVRRRPALDVRVDIFGIVQDDLEYVERLQDRVKSDGRIRLLPPLENDRVVGRLRGYDVLAVPSQWMETGPLVVYDAFLAGLPVVGSRRGGIAELVTHERDGLLVEADDPDAWASAIERLATDRRLTARLRAAVRQPRSMSAVASEMLALYANVLNEQCAFSSAR